MKKVILSVAVLALAGFTTTNASTVKSTPAISVAQQEDVKTPVQGKDLPDPVKKALTSGEDYKGYTITSANLVKTAKGAEYYEFTLKKGEEVKTVKLDKDGKVVA